MFHLCRFRLTPERPGLLQVPWRIRRSRCTEITQVHVAIVFQTVRLARRNRDAVTGSDSLRLVTHSHQPTAFEDEIHLLWPMAVNPLFAARLDHSERCGQMFGAAGPGRGQQVRSDPFGTNVPGRCLFLDDVHEFPLDRHSVDTGTAMNASPDRTMIGSVRSTPPPSPTVAVANRLRRSPVPGSILKTCTPRPVSTPSR